ncbi:MAG: hypothetical protein D6B25_00970 [Desulfobulbaceae bacterium]|nr:MAG: hypothetical protein D6B25_00970 [Desulfobulbaceae bacterium]
MNYQNHYQNSIEFGSQAATGVKIRQTLTRRRITELPGGVSLWVAAVKVSCLILCSVLICSMWISSQIGQAHLEIQKVEAQHHALRAESKELRKTKAHHYSKDQVRRQAGEQLALYVPGDDQVHMIR